MRLDESYLHMTSQTSMIFNLLIYHLFFNNSVIFCINNCDLLKCVTIKYAVKLCVHTENIIKLYVCPRSSTVIQLFIFNNINSIILMF